MEHVLIEREFDEPVAYDGFRGAKDADPGCFDRLRVSYHGSFVALDGRIMLCHTMAPDAESVRHLSDLHQVRYTRIWTADMHRGDDHTAETLPATLVPHDGQHDTLPYRCVSVVSGKPPRPLDLDSVLASARDLLGPGARHLFSYVQRTGDRYIGIFAHDDPTPRQGHGLTAYPAHARRRKRRT